jgi:hypothetical protein
VEVACGARRPGGRAPCGAEGSGEGVTGSDGVVCRVWRRIDRVWRLVDRVWRLDCRVGRGQGAGWEVGLPGWGARCWGCCDQVGAGVGWRWAGILAGVGRRWRLVGRCGGLARDVLGVVGRFGDGAVRAEGGGEVLGSAEVVRGLGSTVVVRGLGSPGGAYLRPGWS